MGQNDHKKNTTSEIMLVCMHTVHEGLAVGRKKKKGVKSRRDAVGEKHEGAPQGEATQATKGERRINTQHTDTQAHTRMKSEKV